MQKLHAVQFLHKTARCLRLTALVAAGSSVHSLVGIEVVLTVWQEPLARREGGWQ